MEDSLTLKKQNLYCEQTLSQKQIDRGFRKMEFRLRLISHANEYLWMKAALYWVPTIWQVNKSQTKQSRN